jgi:hypothetical protein
MKKKVETPEYIFSYNELRLVKGGNLHMLTKFNQHFKEPWQRMDAGNSDSIENLFNNILP